MTDLVCPFCACGVEVNTDPFSRMRGCIECVACGAAWDSRGTLMWSNIAPLGGDFDV